MSEAEVKHLLNLAESGRRQDPAVPRDGGPV